MHYIHYASKPARGEKDGRGCNAPRGALHQAPGEAHGGCNAPSGEAQSAILLHEMSQGSCNAPSGKAQNAAHGTTGNRPLNAQLPAVVHAQILRGFLCMSA
jgi:hypothetical protein